MSGVRAGLVCGIGLCLVASPAFAHLPEDIPARTDLLRDWDWDPLLIVLLSSMALLYGIGLTRLWRAAGLGRGIRPHQALCFASSMLLLVLALLSPVHVAGALLFSAHMVQHLLLTVLAAPLFVLGAPMVALAWAVPRSVRRSWQRALAARALLGTLLRPPVAFVLHALATWMWHAPLLYQAALESEAIHLLEHFSFWATSVFFWWTVVAAAGRRSNRHGLAILLLFASATLGGVLGALLTVAPSSLYPGHELGALAFDMTSLEDQQLAGLLMWVPGSAVYVLSGLWTLKRWLDSSEVVVRQRERQLDTLKSIVAARQTELS